MTGDIAILSSQLEATYEQLRQLRAREASWVLLVEELRSDIRWARTDLISAINAFEDQHRAMDQTISDAKRLRRHPDTASPEAMDMIETLIISRSVASQDRIAHGMKG